jgi:hypothetical protein
LDTLLGCGLLEEQRLPSAPARATCARSRPGRIEKSGPWVYRLDDEYEGDGTLSIFRFAFD